MKVTRNSTLRSDDNIADRVLEALASHPLISLGLLEIRVGKGVVTLDGRAFFEEERSAIVEVIDDLAFIEDVEVRVTLPVDSAPMRQAA